MQTLDDLARRCRRREQAIPLHRFETRQTALGDGRNIRCDRHAGRTGHPQRTQAAVTRVLHRLQDRHRTHGNVTGDQINHASTAFIRHMRHADLRQIREQLHRQMRIGADARRRIENLAGPRTRQRDPLAHSARRHRGMHRDQVGHDHRLRHWREIAQGVIGHFAISGRIGRQRREPHQQRVTVGRRFRHQLAADHGARTGAVLDHHLTTEPRGQRLRQQARDDVPRATAGGGHNDAHRLLRIGLIGSERRCYRYCECERRTARCGKRCGIYATCNATCNTTCNAT